MIETMVTSGANGRGFNRPVNMSDSLRTVRIEGFVGRATAILGLAYKIAPGARIVCHFGLWCGRSGERRDGGAAVKMRIDDVELIEVMGVRGGTGGTPGIGAGIGEIIHARVQ